MQEEREHSLGTSDTSTYCSIILISEKVCESTLNMWKSGIQKYTETGEIVS